LRRRLGNSLDLLLAEDSLLPGLEDEHSLQNSPIHERHAEERLKLIFTSLAKILEARMMFDLLHGDGTYLLGDHAGQSFMKREPHRPDRFRPKTDGGGENEIGAVRLKQIDRAHVGTKVTGDKRNNTGQCLRWFATALHQSADLLRGENLDVGERHKLRHGFPLK
jgi:hypothetical protein